MVKNGKNIGFIATPEIMAIIDDTQRTNYRMNQSEVIRMLILAGAETVLGKEKLEKVKKKYA